MEHYFLSYLKTVFPPNLSTLCKICLSAEWIPTANLYSIWTPVLQKEEKNFLLQFLHATCSVCVGLQTILPQKEHTVLHSISKEASDAGPHT